MLLCLIRLSAISYLSNGNVVAAMVKEVEWFDGDEWMDDGDPVCLAIPLKWRERRYLVKMAGRIFGEYSEWHFGEDMPG